MPGLGAMKRITKRALAISLFHAGREPDEIAKALETTPAYVLNVLAAEGLSVHNGRFRGTHHKAGQYYGLVDFNSIAELKKTEPLAAALFMVDPDVVKITIERRDGEEFLLRRREEQD